jgi:hypothetical protein
MMHGHEKSDPAIVAVKPANKVAPRCGALRGGVSRSGISGAKGVDQGDWQSTHWTQRFSEEADNREESRKAKW